MSIKDEIHISIEGTTGSGNSIMYNYEHVGYWQQQAAFGYLALNFIHTFGDEEIYWISHHRRPISDFGNIWNALDKTSWACYALSILLICLVMIIINYYSNGKIDATDIMIQLSLGFFEPHLIKWQKKIELARLIISIWLILGITFNWFFNIDYRTMLLTQTFPPEINNDEHIDVFRDGVFMDLAYRTNSK